MVKGALLMLVSLQVVLLWIGVVAFYNSKGWMELSLSAIAFFLPGVFIGKMMAYYLYFQLSNYIKTIQKPLPPTLTR